MGLPLLGTFVGRRAELAAVTDAVAQHQWVTLTGLAGVGKTRLAAAVGEHVQQQHDTSPHPQADETVWFAELADVPDGDPDRLHRAVAEAVRLHDQSAEPVPQVLARHLASKPSGGLLILDNCEHLVDVGEPSRRRGDPPLLDLVHILLKDTPQLRVLATSRHPLGSPSEHAIVVDALDPDSGDAPALFVERAREHAPDFAPHAPATREAITQLCDRLDGIPLAIELTAARVSSLSPPQILERLGEDRFRFNRGLRLALDASYDLCTAAEQTLWRRLSAFADGFDLTAAEIVCSDQTLPDHEVLDALHTLCARSIVKTVPGGDEPERRYRLLETVRHYGHERLLLDGGNAEALRRRHRDYYAGLLQDAIDAIAATAHARDTAADTGGNDTGGNDTVGDTGGDITGNTEVRWMRALAAAMPNIRAALAACVRVRDGRRGLPLAEAAARTRLGFFAGTLGEIESWLLRMLTLDDAFPDRALRSRAYAAASLLATCQGKPAEVTAGLISNARREAELGDLNPDDMPEIIQAEGYHRALGLQDPSSLRLLTASQAAFEARQDYVAAQMSVMAWTVLAVFSDDADLAARAVETCRDYAHNLNLPWVGSFVAMPWAVHAIRTGDPDQARQLVDEALDPLIAVGDHFVPVFWLLTYAWCLSAQGHHDRAAEAFGVAAKSLTLTGMTIARLAPIAAFDERYQAATRDALGASRFDLLYRHGHGVADVEHALIWVRDHERPRRDPNGLPPQLRETALLVRDGLTNQQIADKLQIGLRTAEGYVAVVRSRLAPPGQRLPNRAALAAEIRKHFPDEAADTQHPHPGGDAQ